MFLQIGFCGVGEFHFHAPAVDAMDALEFFSATGTGLFHRQKNVRPPMLETSQNEYQLFKQHCTGNEAGLERSQ